MKKIISQDNSVLNKDQVDNFITDIADSGAFDNKNILVIIPDNTRSVPMPLLFDSLCSNLCPRTKKLDYLIALGTHAPMSLDKINKHLGMDEGTRKVKYPSVDIYNHRWEDKDTFVELGKISENEVYEISDGLLKEEMRISINEMILHYDLLLIVGPVFPHEVVGFSGGNKYFFPGISAGDMINLTHWLGALLTIPNVIGIKDTPVRQLINKAASFIHKEKLCLSLTVTKEGLKGIFFDTPENSFEEAAEFSKQNHIIYKEKKYQTILAETPSKYDDLWTGGKCVYKLMGVADKNAKLIVYAPHITEISYSHGYMIKKIGYHVKDYFLKQWDQFEDYSKGIIAHSTHVKGLGTFENGKETPEIEVILASGINERICKQINLGYINPDDVNIDDYKNKENEGILYAPQAGEYLYLLK